jgi:hypothetical protein
LIRKAFHIILGAVRTVFMLLQIQGPSFGDGIR